jgi:hypothetical protein
MIRTVKSSPRRGHGQHGDVELVADLIADLTSPDPAGQPGRADSGCLYGDAAYGAGEVLTTRGRGSRR